MQQCWKSSSILLVNEVGVVMKEKFVKDEELVNPERYMQNKVEA